jgi:hypothetical protein
MAKGGGGSRGGSKGGGGGGSSGGGAGSLNSLDKFEPVALKTIQELTGKSESAKVEGIFIADLRDKIGDKVSSREIFDNNLKAMVAKGQVDTITGNGGGANWQRVTDGGITTELGGSRQSVRIKQ